MTEFEKQNPKPKSIPGMVNDDPFNWWVEKQEGWQGALEWVLNMFGANTFHGFPPIDVEKAIKEELEDGK